MSYLSVMFFQLQLPGRRYSLVMLTTIVAAGTLVAQQPQQDRQEPARLPQFDLPVLDLEDLENPLFEPLEIEQLPQLDEQGQVIEPEILPEPEIPIPTAEELDLTPSQRELFSVARKAAPAVLSLRAYDRFGIELSRTAGFFISDWGLIATDVSLVTPDIQSEISYITAIAGDFTTFRIRGVWRRDLENGVIVLQADAINTPYLEFAGSIAADDASKVYLIAFDEERGLLLADAQASFEKNVVGEGWLEVTGEDSQGDQGSPLLNGEGKVVGLVAMKLEQENWINYAIPIGGIPVDSYRDNIKLVSVGNLGQLAADDILESSSFQKAYLSLYQEDYKRALRLLLKLSRSYPRSGEVWALLGLALRNTGNIEDALSAQRKAVALNPDAGSQWRQLAMIEKLAGEEGKEKDIKSALEQAVKERPGDRISWLLLGQEHLKAQEWQQADRALRQVVKIEPDYSRGLFLLGIVRGQLGDYENALALLQRSKRFNKRNAGAWFYTGLLLEHDGEIKDAVKAYERCVRINPSYPNAWANLAYAYRRTGNATKARQAIKKHIASSATDADTP